MIKCAYSFYRKLCNNENKLLLNATAKMNLKNIMLSRRSQAQMITYGIRHRVNITLNTLKIIEFYTSNG